MIIIISERDEIAVVTIKGNLNIKSHLELKSRVRALIAEDGYRKIILDVREITGMDSTGLGVLVSLLNTLRSNGGDLRLVGEFAPQVGEAFSLCGLSHVFVQYPDVETGINNFIL